MSRQINQPINQVKLTNVAVVRYNCRGKRFEIACYRNKVLDYRSGQETDLSEVLQTDRIFTNVSKGKFAKSNDLQEAFGSRNEEDIAKIILQKGDSVQVSNLEREQQYEQTLSQIVTWVAANCTHAQTQRPYTVSQIRNALGKNYQVQPHKAIKKQYLDAVKFLKEVIPIERAKMELSLQYPADKHQAVQDALDKLKPQVIVVKQQQSSDSTTQTAVLVLHADPSLYRELNDLAKGDGIHGRLEILQQVVVSQQGDVDLEDEIERKKQLKGEGGGAADSRVRGARETLKDDESEEEEEEVGQLKEKLQAVRLQAAKNRNGPTVVEDDDDDGDDDDSESGEEDRAPMSRKNQNKARKKKKAKEAKLRKEKQEQQAEQEENANESTIQTEVSQQQQVESSSTANGNDATDAKSCNTCGGAFVTAADYRAHFRSDWHRFNQKLKLKGVPAVSLEEFKLCDADAFFFGGRQE